ncbi:peptidoglycan bridge formation protein FemAB [Tersicoccus solisilvae]|uniref:Peptidoglycan bridge formation protein FemAB n=1 Tax=Tersicoccus solisilvae TaxID=1882339 RepID=A0ABQ1P5W2_9MICC|nr:peptidoglycan bridge formation glycyltransferase FemA/FemB family protein [Tersicoccus solisilvae]GGC90916.1 peptidoglycan bridge formation protein FemAB [Tersicoccus solisilvae]
MDTILQEPAWLAVQRDLGHDVLDLDGTGWHARAVLQRRRIGSFLYCPYGPVVEDPAALPEAIAALTAQARRAGAWFLRLEPMPAGDGLDVGRAPSVAALRAGLAQAGGRQSPSDVQPRRTRLIDLRRPAEDLLADMTGSIRTIHRNGHKKGLTVEASQDPADIAILLGFLEATAHRKGIRTHPERYLRQVAETLMPRDAARLYVTRQHGTPVCAALVYDSPTVRTFAHAAVPAEHRRLRPNQPLIVQAILDARERGQHTADLFGIAPTDDPHHPWAGFTAFKRSFGGVDVDHTGTWDLPVRSATYGLYRQTRQALDASRQGRRRMQHALAAARARVAARVTTPSSAGAPTR